MDIYIKDILEYFEEKNVAFEIRGKFEDVYQIASIFNPIEGGFYYLEKEFKSTIFKNSLILTNVDFQNENGNTIIFVKESPQIIFYELINYYFSEQSTGQINKLSQIHAKAKLGYNVQIDPFCVIGDCEIGNGCIIKSNTVINDNTLIEANTVIEPNCTIGATGIAWVINKNGKKIHLPQLGGVIIRPDCKIGANSVIVRGSLNESTIIETGTVMAPGAKIGHGCYIGKNVHFANNVVLGGNTSIGEFSFIGSSAVFRSKVKLHPHTVVAAGAVVINDTSTENLTLVGVPARETDSKKYLKGIPKNLNHTSNE